MTLHDHCGFLKVWNRQGSIRFFVVDFLLNLPTSIVEMKPKHAPSEQPPPKRAPRKSDIEKKTKEKILQAACRVFARCPVNMATIRMIVAESNINHSLIMYHFGKKNNLYVEVLLRAAEHYANALEPVFSQIEMHDPLCPKLARQLYAELIEKTLDGMYGGSNVHVNIIMLEARYPAESYPSLYEKYFKRHYRLICRLIRTINPRDTEETAMFKLIQIFGLLDSFLGEHEGLKRYINFNCLDTGAKQKIKEMTTQNAFLIVENTL